MMIKIGKTWYDISVAWPLIFLAFVVGIALLLPTLMWLRQVIVS